MTGRTILAEWGCQDRALRTGLSGKERQERIAERMSEKDSQKGQLEKDKQNKRAMTGPPG